MHAHALSNLTRAGMILACPLLATAAILLTACGDGRSDAHGNGGADLPGPCDAAPILETCGCSEGECLSLDVAEWRDRTAIGPDDGLTAYLVAAGDYEEHAAPLATAVPDESGRVVFATLPDEAAYVVFDDTDAASDVWAHTAIELDQQGSAGSLYCVSGPALTRAHADAYLGAAGLDPDSDGAVILETRGYCSSALAGLAVEIDGAAFSYAISADRSELGDGTTLTEASALLTQAGRYCASECTNIDCDCSEPSCGLVSSRTAASGGLFFARLTCLPPY